MAKISPFEAVRPQPQLAKQVASKPYDVLNSAEAKIEAVGNAYSFLHKSKNAASLVGSVKKKIAFIMLRSSFAIGQ